jgi:predicted transcriptional regulator
MAGELAGREAGDKVPEDFVMAERSLPVCEAALTKLQEMAQWSGRPVTEVLEGAIEAEYERRFWDAVNAGYAAMRADPQVWAEELAARQVWETTLMDGLDPAERWPS